METTSGSYALEGSIVPNDAGVITKLRSAGALILGKANQSEWSYFRGKEIASGWSGRGGQCTNPYYPGANSSGSSSGSAVAVAVGLAPVALGTETSGSLTSPAGWNNITTVKPTVGLTSRAGGNSASLSKDNRLKPSTVIPITPHQDTVGPLTRSLTDAAIFLSIIAGPDPNDARTLTQPLPVPSYTSSLLKGKDGLKGKRLGVPRKSLISRYFDSDNCHDAVKEAFERALVILKDADAEVVDHVDLPSTDELFEKAQENRDIIFRTDMKVYNATPISGSGN
jgi:amidase